MVIFAAYFWMVASFINMFIIAFLGYKTKKFYHLLYAVMWLCCGLWGMTVPAVNVPIIAELNTVIIPIVAGFCGTLGASMRLAEVVKEKLRK